MRADCPEPKDGGEYRQAGADARFSGLEDLDGALRLFKRLTELDFV